MTDKSTAAQTGSENTSPATGDKGAGKQPPQSESAARRASVARALESAGIDDSDPAPNQTDEARAVLRDGAGADEELVRKDSERRDRAAKKADADAQDTRDKPRGKTEAKDDDKAGKKPAAKDDDKAKAKASDKDEDDGDDSDDDDADTGKAARDATGRFASKDGEKKDAAQGGDEDTDDKVSDPPARMSEAAKAAWRKAPKEIRGDVHRIMRELDAGLAKHKEGADNWAKLNDGFSPMADKDGKPITYGELSKQMNTTPKAALDNYVSLDMQMSKDPIGTIDKMLKARGMDFRKVAETFLKIDPATLEQHNREQALKDENDRLKREKAQGASTQEREIRGRVENEIATFYTDHPRLAADKEFEADFGLFFTGGRAKTLQEAYEMAEKLHPRKGPKVETPNTADQTRKSELSDSGGRTEASDASSRRERSKSIRGSAERAARDAGL